MTSWDSYPDFLEKLGVPLLLRKLATMGTPIVEVCKPIVHYRKYSHCQNKLLILPYAGTGDL